MSYIPDVFDKAYGRGLDDRNDSKWAHPELKDYWIAGNADFIETLLDEDVPLEKRLTRLEKVNSSTIKYYEKLGFKPFEGLHFSEEGNEYGVLKKFQCKGCPDDPEVTTEVYAVIPNEKKDTPRPVIFYIMGGGYFQNLPGIYPELLGLAKRYDAVVVTCTYSNLLQGKYPTMINEHHAAYLWMLENAEMLNIDPDNVVIVGESGGAHFGLNMAFRLKRYGIIPKGIVAVDPICDDRNQYESNKLIKLPASSIRTHALHCVYYGANNVGSPYVGPEAFANRATVEECKGLPPIFLFIGETDMDRDSTMAFASKLYVARVPCSLHVYYGSAHGTLWFARNSEMADRFWKELYGTINDCIKYDLRRPWAWDVPEDAAKDEVSK